MDGAVLGAFQGGNRSLFLEAASLEELEWMIARQHGVLQLPAQALTTWLPIACGVSFVPETLAENRAKSGSAPGAQARGAWPLVKPYLATSRAACPVEFLLQWGLSHT